MSIDTTKSKIAKLQSEIDKANADLERKISKLISSSGLLELDIPEKDLKKELKSLVDKLKKG